MYPDAEKNEKRRLAQIANEYRDKGFDVDIGPSQDRLPDFMKGYSPDLLATKGNENIIVEVKSKQTLRGADYIADLAKIIEDHPGWRLELVVTSSKEEADSTVDLLPLWEIHHRLRQAEKLLTIGEAEVAIVMAWSALEASIRYNIANQPVKKSSHTAIEAIKTLYSLGVISKDDYDWIEKIRKVKNNLVHGFKTEKVPNDLIRNLIRIVHEVSSYGQTGDEQISLKKWKIVISKHEFQKLQKDELFLSVVLLARILNSINFIQIAGIATSSESTPSAARQTIATPLYLGALLYEGLEVGKNISKFARDFQSYRDGFGELNKDKSVREFYKTTLNTIRNKIVFHFNADTVRAGLDGFDTEEIVFATGHTSYAGHAYYALADEVVIHYLLGRKSDENELLKDYENICITLGSVLKRFLHAANSLLTEVMASYESVQLIEGNGENGD